MHPYLPNPPTRGLALALNWPRLRAMLKVTVVMSVLLSLPWQSPFWELAIRVLAVALCGMLVFGFFEQLPPRLPRWIARWALQVIAVAVSVPISLLAIYIYSTEAGQPPFWKAEDRIGGFALLCLSGLLVAPWVALAALIRQKDALFHHQALAFNLERSELERRAVDARLRLLQAQVEPHFLFNTLANVRALVNAGAPQASQVLDSLIAYLRAAVPRLQQPGTTVEQELQLVCAYLELMQMRMPDRLQFTLDVDGAVLPLDCPPMTLLTLVENAVRHGIDPSEEGGRIDVSLQLRNGRCEAQVLDTGVGLGTAQGGLGTGLQTLNERLQLCFGGDAQLNVVANTPRGVRARLHFPARLPGQ